MSTSKPTSLLASVGKPRLADVARIAGVSAATVSRVLSSPELVRGDTREKVSRAVRELGYVPDGAARALASRRTRTVGFAMPTLTGAIFAGTAHALQTRLFEAGYHLLVACHNYDPKLETVLTRALIERGVDALVLVGRVHEPELLRTADQFQVPILLTWTLDPSGLLPSIGFDNRLATMRVVRHLLDLGHRRFGVISGYLDYNDRARDRLAGAHDALTEAGLALPQECIVEEAFTLAGGHAGLSKLLALAAPPTAVICGNDQLAAGALLEAQRTGVAVPGELSIVGFDDTELASQLSPGITTVRVAQGELGRRAAEHLIRRLSGGDFSLREEVPADLILRGSSGVAPIQNKSP